MIRCTNSIRVAFALSLLPLVAIADGGYLRSAVPMDEPRGYCLDVAGFGVNARPDEPLRVHTCKYGEDNIDQLFRWVDFETGHVVMPAYERCLAAESLQPGARVFVNECGDSELQSWTFVPNGNLVLRAKPDLCLTIGEERFDAGSEVLVFPGYQYRSSTMQLCRERGDALQNFRWGRDDEHVRGKANALREGMPANVQAEIRRMHETGAEGVLAKTGDLYKSVERSYRPSEVKTTADIAYGEHERHKLDIHVDTRRRGDALQPVVMYFHGGGYLRGAKENSRNVGEYFASIGLVGVSATYRLAPEIQWPDGANDVGAAVQWVKEDISEYGGDPDRIYVIGKSAGGGHVATYALRPDVLSDDYARAAGIILVSGGLDVGTAEYFGADDDSASKAVLGNVSSVDMDVMLTTAEFDAYGMIARTLALANELASEHDHLARVRQLPGHNHFSTNMSIATSDRLLSNEILDFVLETSND
jgi:triacylglycerol lipase